MGARGRPPPPNHEGWRIPRAIPPCSLLRAPRSAGTHRPAAACVLSAAQGEVCVRVSTGNGGRPATREPQARRPPGAPRGRGRGAPRFRGSAQFLPPGIRSANPHGQLRTPAASCWSCAWGLGHLDCPVLASREAGEPDLAEALASPFPPGISRQQSLLALSRGWARRAKVAGVSAW